MKHPDWTLDVKKATATHRTGMILVATRTSGNQFDVRPKLNTLPTLASTLSSVDRDALNEVITQRVMEGGKLLVQALGSLHS